MVSGARLMRQPAFGDWDSVIASLHDELLKLNPTAGGHD